MSGAVTASVAAQFKPQVVDVSVDSTVIFAGRTLLRSVYINVTLSAHAVEIKNGSITVFIIPASAAAGTRFEFDDVVFGQNLTIVPNAAATGSITVNHYAYE